MELTPQNESYTTESIAAWVISCRERRRMTQAQLAQIAGLSRATIQRLENGGAFPKPRAWIQLVEILQMEPRIVAIQAYYASETRCARLIRLAWTLLEDFTKFSELLPNLLDRIESANTDLFNRRYQGDVYHLRAFVSYMEGDYDAAGAWFVAMERGAVRSGGPTLSRALYNHGLTACRLGHWEMAILKLERASRLAEEVCDRLLLGYSHWALGTILLELKSYKEALVHYLVASDLLNTVEQGAYSRFGEVVCRWAIHGDARTALDRFLELEPTAPKDLRPKIWEALAVASRQGGKYEQALEWLDRLFKRQPLLPVVRMHAGQERLLCLCLLGRIDEAHRQLDNYLSTVDVSYGDVITNLPISLVSLVLGTKTPLRHTGSRGFGHEQRAEAFLQWATLTARNS